MSPSPPPCRLVNLTRGSVVAERVERAEGALQRMRGLLGRAGLADGEALVIAPCTSIHTFFMRFPLDVLFLDRGLAVLRALEAVPPFRATRLHLRAACAVELAAGSLRRSGTRAGDLLRLDDGPPERPSSD